MPNKRKKAKKISKEEDLAEFIASSGSTRRLKKILEKGPPFPDVRNPQKKSLAQIEQDTRSRVFKFALQAALKSRKVKKARKKKARK